MKCWKQLLVVAVVATDKQFCADARGADEGRASLDSARRDRRMQWWHEAKFGMFIHWAFIRWRRASGRGNTTTALVSGSCSRRASRWRTTNGSRGQFNPVKFDADAWAQLAQDAGMKYLIITSKHHDGFAMFGSKVDAFNIVDATPFKRDPMKELAAVCAKRGIKFGFYYSQAQDWSAPGGAIWEGRHENDPVYADLRWDPKQNGDFEPISTPRRSRRSAKF